MSNSEQQVSRLAMRQEGDWWVAYYAMPETMTDAIELGRVQMGIVQDRDRKERFMVMMKDAVGDFIRDATGAEPSGWNRQTAPEHERSGRA